MRALTFLSTVFLLWPLAPFAQSPAPNPAATWRLPGMQGSAVVILFHPDSARVQKESKVVRLHIVRRQGVVRLSDKREDVRVLTLLGIGPGPVVQQYGPDEQALLPTEKLLTAAERLPDDKLLLEGLRAPADGNDTTLAQEDPANETARDQEDKSPWLYTGIAAVLALIAGWLAGRASRRKAAPAATAHPAQVYIGEPIKASAADEATGLKTALQQAQQELQGMQAADRQLFSGAFDKLVLPLQSSLEQADKARTLALLAESAAMLGSITRHKLAKKGKHDDANLRLLTSSEQTATDAPAITGLTPPDQMPQHLRALVALLRENGVTGLDGVLMQGYDLRDL